VATWRTRGQPAALAGVARAVTTGRVPPALLLSGPLGSGRTTLALDLAAGLLCSAADPADRPCRACSACRRLDRGNHPDLHRLAPSGAGRQIRIGDRGAPEPGTVRHLVRELALAPMEGRWRVAIVEQAERMNEDAQNALLKLLEEPPAGTVLILCAGDDEALLPTVRSRCTRLRLGAVPAADMAALLVERDAADPARAAALARLADGRPGRALALASEPETVVLMERLARELLDLGRLGRAGRLAAAAGLVEAADRAETLLDPEDGDGARRPGSDEGEAGGGSERGDRRSPAARRRAVLALGTLWRDLARDVAIAARGDRAGLHHVDLLEDVVAAASAAPPGSPDAFLVRLDRTLAAVERNANPELALDTLLLAWPGRAADPGGGTATASPSALRSRSSAAQGARS
jgi:DNA polymerase-3 subunit delta'